MNDRVGQRFGNYRLIRLLGRGTFAEVYLGEHVYLQTQAAIKVLQLQLAGYTLENFLAEARTIARLRHPSIVGLLEFGVEGKTPFLVMDYAPNGSLRQRHPKGSRLPVASVVSYVKQITSALQYAHGQKLIHRDIKPENLLLGADNELLLADFGLALIAKTEEQTTQEIAGTPAYMAPEQLRGKPRQASDQYALGVIVYEWLTGSPPFRGSFGEVASQHLYTAPPSLRSVVPYIPPAVEYAVMTALAKDPGQRFARVQEFANALEQACWSGPSPIVVQLPNPPMVLPLASLQTKGAVQSSSERSPQPLAKTVPQLLPTQRERRHLSASKIILLMALALLILGGSGLLYYMRIVQAAQLQARTHATTPTSTSSTTQLYIRATNGTPDLDSSLNLNDPSWNWVEYPGSQSGSCAFREGAYYATAPQKGSSLCLAQGTDVSNLAYQVQMTIVTGDEGGLVFRSDSIDQNNYPFSTSYYLFSIGHDGHYTLSYHSDKPAVQLTSGSNLAIKMGLNQPNLLTVIAHGNNISVYVNKHYIASVSDSKRSSGLVGVFALSDGNPTDVRFSNAQEWGL